MIFEILFVFYMLLPRSPGGPWYPLTCNFALKYIYIYIYIFCLIKHIIHEYQLTVFALLSML